MEMEDDKKKWIAVIMVIGVVYFLWAGQADNEAARSATAITDGMGNVMYSRGAQVPIIDEDDNDPVDLVPDVNPTNACDYLLFGYPDYDGTNKEGETCADANAGEEDMECLNNPPTNYDGLIIANQGISDPLLSCCIEDGTCYWVDAGAP